MIEELEAVTHRRERHGFHLESQIGNTPLLRLRHLTRDLPPGVELYVKAEHLNPGGSVKDRPALSMILEGEKAGHLYPGKTILDATSGNTGIAYAMVGAARHYPVTLCLPKNASEENELRRSRDCDGAGLADSWARRLEALANIANAGHL